MGNYWMLSLIVLVAGVAAIDIHRSAPQKLWGNDAILALSYNEVSKQVTAFSEQRKIEGGTTFSTASLTSKDQVSGIAEDDVVGKVSVNYFTDCLTLTRPDKSTVSVGVCTGKADNVTKIPIKPYSVAIGKNGQIVFTHTYSHAVRIWHPDSGAITTLVDDPALVRPRGIVYNSSSDGYYVAMSNGVYSTKERKVITGVSDEYNFGMTDGPLDQARFNHPTGIVLLRPGILAVADYSNNRIRVVNTIRGEVTSLCTTSGSNSCSIDFPISLAVNKELTHMYIGTANGLLKVDLIPPKNLCYGISKSGVETITVKGKSMQVWCDMDTPNGPWITLMKRYDGSQDFKQMYSIYTKGFGTVSAEHWLGLENMHLLTENKMSELRIDVEGFRAPRRNTINAYAHYAKFWIGDGASGYTLEEIAGYSGTAGDMESTSASINLGGPHKGQKFSAPDKDEDSHITNCAAEYNGGWWFRQCYTACLTCGPYTNPPKRRYGGAMIYFPYTRMKLGLKSASMKIKLPQSMVWDN